MRKTVWPRALAALVVSFAACVALADPPGRVARVAEYSGELRIASSYSDWQPAYRNHVITAGDNVWLSDGGRAELDVGPLQVWLSGGANVYFERFDDHNLVARLAAGSIAVRIRQWEPKDAMRVTTEHGDVSFVQPGLYFVSAGGGQYPSVASARFGQAELNSFGRVQWINRGDSFAFDQNGARYDRYAYSGSATGGFEGWVLARDRRIDRWEARHRGDHNPWIVGVRDLDDHGYWESSYEYGRVWYPRAVSYDWAPYRYGRWTWVQPWGWTWVDDAPWGFAPFHYGRWVRVGGRWAWCPGSYVGRAVYAPALVTFYGGNNWSVNVSTGPTYSWVPLGWNEPFVPWYTYTPNYWRHVNRPYVRNTAEDPWRPPAYVHARVPGAVTTIAAAALVGGRHVSQNYVRNTAEIDLRSAPPARMGEVIPQFRGIRVGEIRSRSGDPNPVVSSAPAPIAQPPIRGGVVTESAPVRGAPPAAVSERAPTAVLPNRNVAEVRVWQDPNPMVPRVQREAAPVVRESMPNVIRESAPAVVRESAPTAVREGAQGVPNRGIPEREYRRQEAPPEQRSTPGSSGNPVQERAAPPVIRDKKPVPVQEYRGEALQPRARPVAEPSGGNAVVERAPRRANADETRVAAVRQQQQLREVARREQANQATAQRERARTEAREVKNERRNDAARHVEHEGARGNKVAKEKRD
jgi:hypothetical protein